MTKFVIKGNFKQVTETLEALACIYSGMTIKEIAAKFDCKSPETKDFYLRMLKIEYEGIKKLQQIEEQEKKQNDERTN